MLYSSLARVTVSRAVRAFASNRQSRRLSGSPALVVDLEFYGFDGGVAGDVVETLARGQGTDLERVEVLGRALGQGRPGRRGRLIGGGGGGRGAEWQRTDWRCRATAQADDWARVEGEEQTAWSQGHSCVREDGKGGRRDERRSKIFILRPNQSIVCHMNVPFSSLAPVKETESTYQEERRPPRFAAKVHVLPSLPFDALTGSDDLKPSISSSPFAD